ncbi:MAG: hypothetical protein AB7I33_01375 [Gemmatimonadales bacterium]
MTSLRTLTSAAAAVAVLNCAGSAPATDPAAAVLAGALRAEGGSAAAAVSTIYTRADVQGPDRAFETLIWSARDGRVRMEQTTGFGAGVVPGDRWMRNRETGELDSLDQPTEDFVRGHELHAMVLMPENRLRHPEYLGIQEWDGTAAILLRYTDRSGHPVLAAFSTTDTLPLGLQITFTDPDVFIRFRDWVDRAGVRVFREAEFRQEDEIFTYRFADIELDSLADSAFKPPTQIRQPETLP